MHSRAIQRRDVQGSVEAVARTGRRTPLFRSFKGDDRPTVAIVLSVVVQPALKRCDRLAMAGDVGTGFYLLVLVLIVVPVQ